jgi:hypothetical protein
MAEKAHSIPAPLRESCAKILASLFVALLMVLTLCGTMETDAVVSGHAYAVEVVR